MVEEVNLYDFWMLIERIEETDFEKEKFLYNW